MKIYHQGVDRNGIRIWFFAAGLVLLMSGAMAALGLSNSMFGITAKEEEFKNEILKNQLYSIDNKPVYLRDGFHIFSSTLSESEKEKINPYDSYDGPYYVRYETGTVGDLNRDGKEDGVAVLGVNYGGTGYTIHLAAVLSQPNGTYKHIGSFAFKDRDGVEDVSVNNGVVTVVSIEHGPDDASCCPSLHIVKKLTLADFSVLHNY